MLGIVGTGWGADAYAMAAASLGGVSFAVGRDAQRRIAFCERYGIGVARDSLEGIPLPDQCPLVAVCVPPHVAPSICLNLAARGYYVLLDKPGATDPSTLLALCDKDGMDNVAVGYQLRHASAFRWLKQHVSEGSIGTPKHAYLRTYLSAPAWSRERRHWSIGQGAPSAWVEAGVHMIDLAAWLLGPFDVVHASPIRVSGQCQAGVAVLHHLNGCVTTLEVSYLGANGNRRGQVDVVGDLGVASLDRGTYVQKLTQANISGRFSHELLPAVEDGHRQLLSQANMLVVKRSPLASGVDMVSLRNAAGLLTTAFALESGCSAGL